MPDHATPAPSRTRAVLVPCLKAAVSLALLAVLFSRVDVGRLFAAARNASAPWLAGALALYTLMVLASAWRWGVLLTAQNVRLPYSTLTSSFLVATFFNNFLPSNIGGDVVRVADTAPAAGSKTLATTVVLLDRGLGLLGLVLIARTPTPNWRRSPGTASSNVTAISPRSGNRCWCSKAFPPPPASRWSPSCRTRWRSSSSRATG
jgi:uncharacterized membrane protein YbhN (UPF0104 family)